MLAHACVRARAAAGGGRVRDRVWVWVPYLAWFFLNRVSRVWVTPLPDPLQPTRQRVSANGSEPPANGCRKTVRAVGRLDS